MTKQSMNQKDACGIAPVLEWSLRGATALISVL